MARNIAISELADAVMEGLQEYGKLAADDMKKAVRNAGNRVRKEIAEGAPWDTGAYSESWQTKKIRETSSALTLVVHSKNRYQLAHLLEYGHAKRGGGRVEGKAHIAPAEAKGAQQLQQEIERALRG